MFNRKIPLSLAVAAFAGAAHASGEDYVPYPTCDMDTVQFSGRIIQGKPSEDILDEMAAQGVFLQDNIPIAIMKCTDLNTGAPIEVNFDRFDVGGTPLKDGDDYPPETISQLTDAYNKMLEFHPVCLPWEREWLAEVVMWNDVSAEDVLCERNVPSV